MTNEKGLRGRVTRQGEEAIGKVAHGLLDNPVVTRTLSATFEARGRATRAQELAMSALNLPSAGDLERLTRRLRSVSQRLETIEDGLDRVEQRIESGQLGAAGPIESTARLSASIRGEQWNGIEAATAERAPRAERPEPGTRGSAPVGRPAHPALGARSSSGPIRTRSGRTRSDTVRSAAASSRGRRPGRTAWRPPSRRPACRPRANPTRGRAGRRTGRSGPPVPGAR